MTRERLICGYCLVAIGLSNSDALAATGELKTGDSWQTGDRSLVSVRVSGSQNERSSNCTITLEDPNNEIAAKYMAISFKEQGIVGLPPEPSQTSSTLTTADLTSSNIKDVPAAIVAECKRQGVTAPHKIAFILAVAQGESSFNHNAYNDEGGEFGQYGGRGLGQITHDYNYQKYSKKLGIDLVGNPDLAFRPDISTTILVAGIKEGWTGAGGIDKWLPSPESNRQTAYVNIQGGVWRSDYETFYKKWTRDLSAIAATSSANLPVSANQGEIPDSELITAKGRIIEVRLGFEASRAILTSEFIHTGTDTNDKGQTVFYGQSIRYALNRIKKNAAFKDITLAQLAQKVANAYGLTAEVDDRMNSIKLPYVDQSGITDYQLLLRECNYHGFQVSDRGASLVFSRPKAIESGFILYYLGGDLDTWSIQDKAASQLEPIKDASAKFGDFSESTVKDEAKTLIDPTSGQILQIQKEPSREKVKSRGASIDLPGTSGMNAIAPVSNPTGSSAATRYVMKRVKGLPATFTSPTSPAMLRLTPNTAFNTLGHPQAVFNRIWLIDSIEHSYDLGKVSTTIQAFTPMDAKVPETQEGGINREVSPEAGSGSSQTPSHTGWVHPISPGSATSCGDRCEFGNARGRGHFGLDYGGYGNDNVLAARDGTVITARNSLDDDYGKLVIIRHADGWQTRYAHLASISVAENSKVKAGQVIGVRGGSGEGSMTRYDTHLHFEIRRPDGSPVNPRDVLPKEGAPPKL